MESIPTTVTGGCLCEGVRYQIDFAPDHDWENTPNTCQCTQCRKMTGSLVGTFHTVKTTELTWLAKPPTRSTRLPRLPPRVLPDLRVLDRFIDLAVEGILRLRSEGSMSDSWSGRGMRGIGRWAHGGLR
ncbi:hypothetical protein B0H17DRAFT_994820 [Mycena rosella]|uniref:CENP-V/GFA domain-containing protein n=1 Tax=Mycena rosella TaxID=1033263 RepID=A0AAD7C694_MYCRO|nr:hypothetical protein B0H17DRAFT_994820 [Mycena rosella]